MDHEVKGAQRSTETEEENNTQTKKLEGGKWGASPLGATNPPAPALFARGSPRPRVGSRAPRRLTTGAARRLARAARGTSSGEESLIQEAAPQVPEGVGHVSAVHLRARKM